METSTSIQHEPVTQPLFQIVPRDEDGNEDFTPAANKTPFTELRRHPDKLEAALKIAKMENDAFDASRIFSRSPGQSETPTVPIEINYARQHNNDSRFELKVTEFHLKSPSAESVKLAADFTDWEKYPLDLIKSEDGVWYADVPLSPGQYAYRFIVDGRWHDDPHPAQLAPNPFGTLNAVVKVA